MRIIIFDIIFLHLDFFILSSLKYKITELNTYFS